MSSCESALVYALMPPVQGSVAEPVLTWIVTGEWPRAAVAFDAAYARPAWSDPLGL